jgi:hypothetical protein
MIEPFESFKLYQSLKLHFESDSYDALKYNFKTSAKPQSFFKRKDKYFFAKLGKQQKNSQGLVEYYVANFINDVKWVGDMINEDGERNYAEYKRIQESLSYHFGNDINTLESKDLTFDELLTSKEGEHPEVIKAYLQGEIKLETLVILNKMTGFMNRAKKVITETLIFPDLYRKVTKYQSFVNPDMDKCKKIILKGFTS